MVTCVFVVYACGSCGLIVYGVCGLFVVLVASVPRGLCVYVRVLFSVVGHCLLLLSCGCVYGLISLCMFIMNVWNLHTGL